MSEPFYRAFEDRHRGSRDAIQARQGTYLPFLRALRESDGAPALVDLGCGRGEWLELAHTEGWRVQGVDLDGAMLQACREAGLEVRQGDALEFVRGLQDASVHVVSGFHVAEHLPFDALQSLVQEALRVLRPGGLLILETPNPENLVVGSSAFHMDPTHVRPLPPALLAFLAEFAGFAKVATLRLHEGIAPHAPVELIDVLAGVSPDYAIVALKGGGAPSAALDELLAAKHGVTLNELAQRYDQRLETRLRELESTLELAREAATQFGARRREMIARMQAIERTFEAAPKLESHAIDRMFQLQDRIRAMEASTSWRITSPLRWAGAKRLQLAYSASQMLLRFPRLRLAVRALARTLRLVPRRPPGVPEPAASASTPASAPAPALDPASMSAGARRVRELLVRGKER
jgi:O-antigen chain-terminating methyltransferase